MINWEVTLSAERWKKDPYPKFSPQDLEHLFRQCQSKYSKLKSLENKKIEIDIQKKGYSKRKQIEHKLKHF